MGKKLPLVKDKPILKWHEYIMNRNKGDSEEETKEAMDGSDIAETSEAETSESGTSETGDSALDDEVARIMAAFSGAKQNGVDSVIQQMQEQEELLSQISGAKQDNVDAFIKQAKN